MRERVAEELKRLKEQQEQVNQEAYGQLARKNIENDHNSIAMKEDIETMIEKMKRFDENKRKKKRKCFRLIFSIECRSAPAEIPTEIAERQEALIVCYK